MELLVLDTNLVAVDVMDRYDSLIWTDRYDQYGDFELQIPMSSGLLSVLQQNFYIFSAQSNHLMIIEKLEIDSDMEDGNKLLVSGRSLESILDRRIIWGQKTYSGNLQDAIESMLNDAFINPPASLADRKISNFIFKKSEDERITKLTIDAQYSGDNLYDVVYNLCNDNSIGYRVTLSDEDKFVFELYIGEDRSYDQDVLPYVIFSKKFDNMEDSNFLQDNTDYKNAVLVGGEGEGSLRKYKTVIETSSSDKTGLNRRETFVSATDVSSSKEDTKVFASGVSDYGLSVAENSAIVGEKTIVYKTGSKYYGLSINANTASFTSGKITANGSAQLYTTESIDLTYFKQIVIEGTGLNTSGGLVVVKPTSGFTSNTSGSLIHINNKQSMSTNFKMVFNLEEILHKHIGFISFLIPMNGTITNIYMIPTDDKTTITKESGMSSNFKLYTTSEIDFTGVRRLSVSGSNITNSTGGKLIVRASAGYTTDVNGSLFNVNSTQEKSSDGSTSDTTSTLMYDFSTLNHAVKGYISLLVPCSSYSSDKNPNISSISLEAIQMTDDEYYELLGQKGTDTLNEHLYTISFEGEVDTNTMFKYGKDFFIGDEVQIVDEYGHTGKSRVTELVYSHDENGEVTYPTFTTLE